MRVLAICAALAGCGLPDGALGSRAATPSAGGAGPEDAPAARLPDGVSPVRYDLTLELDPDRSSFAGRVAIEVDVAAPTSRLWLHAVELHVSRAVVRGERGEETVRLVGGAAGSQMLGVALPRAVGPGRVTLAFEYTGRVSDVPGVADGVGKDEQGLFRERTGGRWYLYSQAESVFARRIVPCFDEPRFKSAWRVSVIAPRDQVALGNAPVLSGAMRADGRREVRFAEVAALPSYLLAVAVGPFELVDAGRLGRRKIPVRLAVAPGDERRIGAAKRELPKLVDALEAYVDAPLPLAKLDLVAVPEFFGAMENPGLITFRAAILATDHEFVDVAAHELAHQWFGDAVTPAWWDELWLSEAFASWLGDKVTEQLGAAPPLAIEHRERGRALAADDAIDARGLIHPIASSSEVEPAFDALAYGKGAAVLAMFERFVGAEAFRVAVRSYVAAHAGRSVTSQAFLDALAVATRAVSGGGPEVGRALASNLAHAGTPVVEIQVRCGPAPTVIAEARGQAAGQNSGQVTVPVCVRYPMAPDETVQSCWLVGQRREMALAARGCPAWLVGNDGGRGYYRTSWRGVPLGVLSSEERLARGDDVAMAVRRGELAVGDALDELAVLAGGRELYGQLAALEIARAIDALVDDGARPAWTAWLAARFAERMTSAALLKPRTIEDAIVRRAVLDLARDRVDHEVARTAVAAFERAAPMRDPRLVQIAAVVEAEAVFDQVAVAAARSRSEELREAALDAMGDFPAAFAPRVVEVLLDGRFAPEKVWPALAAMLARGETRSAAWRAIHGRFGAVIAALRPGGARDAITALAVLCDRSVRGELAGDVATRLGAIDGGRRVVDRTLATIDRCVGRRAAAGDVAAALARPVRSGL